MIKLMGVSCLYEIVMTILDYQFKVLGSHSKQAHLHNVEAGDGFAQLLGHFGQFTNMLSFLLSFFGFSYLVHNLGVRKSLMIFPATLFLGVVITNLVPSLWALFVMVSIMKAMIFSLQDPVHELLYIPTSDAIKFKVKAWIDVFGSRLAKAMGSAVCTWAGGNAAQLRTISEIPCLLVAATILVITYFIGVEFEQLIASKTFIGADLEQVHVNPAVVQLEALASSYSNYAPGEGAVAAAAEAGRGSGLGSGLRTSSFGKDKQSGEDIEMAGVNSFSSSSGTRSGPQGRLRTVAYPDRNDPNAVRNGLRPGDVGYDGYDLHLFEGVFEEDGVTSGERGPSPARSGGVGAAVGSANLRK
jgi:AAA family ATP:ADP antiporter